MRGGYVPDEAKEKLGMEQEAMDEEESEEEDEEEDEEEADNEEASERPALQALLADPTGAGLLEAAELEAEAAGGEDALLDLRKQHATALKAFKKKNKRVPELSEEAEARDMAKMLLSNKQRKLYNRVGQTATKKKEDKLRLEAKKRLLSKKAAK